MIDVEVNPKASKTTEEEKPAPKAKAPKKTEDEKKNEPKKLAAPKDQLCYTKKGPVCTT